MKGAFDERRRAMSLQNTHTNSDTYRAELITREEFDSD
jgi:hypothetical protein